MVVNTDLAALTTLKVNFIKWTAHNGDRSMILIVTNIYVCLHTDSASSINMK